VDEVDGQNDFGEDLYLRFTDGGQVTGDMVRIQVKGGRSSRRANGYGVPVDQHGDTWCDGNVPVICVVHDPETEGLYWANATEQLLSARRERRVLKTVTISTEDLLDDGTMVDFVVRARSYVGRYRGNQAVRTQLGEMAGVRYGQSDIVRHFVNEHGEDLIFWQRRGEGYATLLHSDLDWEPEYIGPETLHFDKPTGMSGLGPVPTVGNVILNMAEALWLSACFTATRWTREPARDCEPPEARVEVRDQYVSQRIRHRLLIEPDLVARSLGILRSGSETDPDILAEMRKLESDSVVLDEANSASSETWDDMSPEARRLATLYCVENVVLGVPCLPIDKQFRIIWRWTRSWGEYGFPARVGKPSTRLTSQREIASAGRLAVGDRIYWLSRSGNERSRLVSDIWDSDETPGAICVLFDRLSLGDTFWPGEQFARAIQR
jgi:hypothetical protein